MTSGSFSYDKPIERILAKFTRPKKEARGWKVSCPAHTDSDPSLSITEGDDGRVLLNCFAGCTANEIVEALGITMSDLFPPKPPYEPGKRKLVATYNYEDAEGNLAFQVVRYEPKDFRQRRPGTNGEWVWQLGDTPRVLYRLPELLAAAPLRTVFFCEGEKDAERLRELDLLATTSPHGAGKWKPDYEEVLRGRRIVILPDNDEAGLRHAEQVQDALRGKAAVVRVLKLPGLGAKEDVSDWLDKGHSRDELVALAKEALKDLENQGNQEPIYEDVNPVNPLNEEGWEGQAQEPRVDHSIPSLVCMADVVAEPVDWLWTDFLARGKFALWEGDPGVGKTFALLAAGSQLTRGWGLPGMEARDPMNVLLLTVEDDLADTIKPRLEALKADTSRFYAFDDSLQLDDNGLALLDRMMDTVKPGLLILDPIMAYIPGTIDIYKPNQIRRITTPLKALADKYNCALVGIRHLTKSQKDRAIYRGAGGMDFVGASRIVVLVGADPNDAKKRAIVNTKTNLGGQGRSVGYTVEGGEFYWTGESGVTADEILSAGQGDDEKSAVGEAVEFLKEMLNCGPRKAKDIFREAEEAGLKVPTIKKAKKVVGVVTSRHGEEGVRGGGMWLWALPGHTSTDDAA